MLKEKYFAVLTGCNHSPMSLFYKSMKIGTNAIYGMLIHNKLGKQKLAPGLYALKRKTNGK